MLPESAKPYLLNAVYQWCVDQGHTPYILVVVAYPGVSVPSGYEKDGRMILDVSPRACHSLNMADDWITFNARFGGVARTVDVPMAAVAAIYAAETQEGMGFADPEMPSTPPPTPEEGGGVNTDKPAGKPERPALRVVK
ncbi:Stringent starvation protein B [Acidithiobacillus ferrivorans SS3]|uniref:Stringent starvation protein B n=1 Tax=Acidithiobacillus ferrivorans SS3 TaxID=743299 RepID=G0JSK2_9PROT|nr:ClpXP protease specificity-enhancing factor [Acidithiobacillus ferrivorans]AEM48910.1 Stringent starvation protein B [Acidithiobacillus ferrivorans SS3]MBU2765401.1 ClpXP protease specificity-enhancing factor [Acidithiobacillus ferrivorans]MBU2850256.1 ClpXP protease specificity-enhancing factor [Acidithiobacillus ferrivorans]OFA17802.1 stringent starvation protein B [Acidithiobacillus ferrivorans]